MVTFEVVTEGSVPDASTEPLVDISPFPDAQAATANIEHPARSVHHDLHAFKIVRITHPPHVPDHPPSPARPLHHDAVRRSAVMNTAAIFIGSHPPIPSVSRQRVRRAVSASADSPQDGVQRSGIADLQVKRSTPKHWSPVVLALRTTYSATLTRSVRLPEQPALRNRPMYPEPPTSSVRLSVSAPAKSGPFQVPSRNLELQYRLDGASPMR